jgi:hypothetical protein
MCKKRSSQSPSRLQFSRPVAAGTMSGSRRLQLTPPADTLDPAPSRVSINDSRPTQANSSVGCFSWLATAAHYNRAAPTSPLR